MDRKLLVLLESELEHCFPFMEKMDSARFQPVYCLGSLVKACMSCLDGLVFVILILSLKLLLLLFWWGAV